MPIPQATPELLLSNQFSEIQNQLVARANALGKAVKEKKIDSNTYNSEIEAIQSQLDKHHQVFQQNIGQIRQTQQLKTLGLIDPSQADEAAWRMVLPPETARAMFVKSTEEKPGTPLSPNTLTSPAMTESIAGYAGSGTKTPTGLFGLGKGKVDHFSLLEQYKAWREFVGYGQRPPVQRRQLDMQWDTTMKQDSKYDWQPQLESVKVLRNYGPLSKAYNMTQPSDTSVVQPSAMTNPIAESISKELQKRQKPTAAPGTVKVKNKQGQVGTIPAEDLQQALAEGYTQV